MADEAVDASRGINPALMAGLIALPLAFVWVLLLPGYASSTRLAAFLYALMPPALIIAVSLLSAGFGS